MNHLVRAEAARAELDELGAKHFLDVRATVRRMLEDLSGPRRAAFATTVADRMLATHKSSYKSSHASRSLLDDIWRGLGGDHTTDEAVAAEVGRFYLSPLWRRHRHDDPTDLDDHLVMVTLYAAECYLHGCLEFATWTGWRGFDAAAITAAADVVWPHRRPSNVSLYAWELAHPVVQGELERQLEDVELLSQDGDGVDAATLARLRDGAEPV